MASLTCIYIIIHHEHFSYHLNATNSNISFCIALRKLATRGQSVPEQSVAEKPVPEQHVPEQVFADQHESHTSSEQIAEPDLPSSSNLAIQTCAPARTTNVPSSPTLFLDFTILADVCENIFQELNKLVGAINNLVHKESYKKQWRRLRERVEFVLSELQRSSLDAQDIAQNNLKD